MSLLNKLRAPKGAVQEKKRLGRGESSGLGKTSGRGHKGQKARAGGYHKVGFEGGQMPLHRRIPKRGFFSLNRVEYSLLNISDLAIFPAGETVDLASLNAKGLIKSKRLPLKVLGDGEIKIALTVKADRFSKMAKDKIEKAGGQAVLVEKGE